MSDLKRRLASACARGSRQQALVNELLAGPARTYLRPVGNKSYRGYGQLEVGHKSFINLRRRLHAVGFVVTYNRQTEQVIMTFPEEESNQ